MNESDLYWLAGLLEGEGSFLSGCPSKPNATTIQCSMCDEDIISKVAKLFKTKYQEAKRKNKKKHHKKCWVVALRGSRARNLMKELTPLMGERRKKQIEKALASYDPNRSQIKLSQQDVCKIKNLISDGIKTQQQIADEFGVSRSHISHIKRGSTWKHAVVAELADALD